MSKPLQAAHRSVRHADIRPHNMIRCLVPVELRPVIEQIPLDIFTDMTNAGATFAQALAAIYLSGAQNAIAAMKEPK